MSEFVILMDQRDKREYLIALEQERKKIETFQRELPLSLQIVNETIETLRKQLEEQEQKKAVHVEEFTPIINLNISYSENDEIIEQDNNKSDKEKDWSSSLRLWSQESDKDISTADKRTEETASLDNNNRCTSEEGFSNGQEDDWSNRTESKENDKEKKSEEQKCEAQKKTRRSWSQDLHRRFVNALEQLGGPHVATPKHIRELMKVDGLTNDEVKSHLQKYRLHTKKPSSRVRGNSSNTNDYAPTRAPQFVLVGAWVPPADCSGSEDSGGATNIIHSSLVSLPSHLILPHQNQNRNKVSHGSPNSPLEKRSTRDHRTTKSASSQTTNAS